MQRHSFHILGKYDAAKQQTKHLKSNLAIKILRALLVLGVATLRYFSTISQEKGDFEEKAWLGEGLKWQTTEDRHALC